MKNDINVNFVVFLGVKDPNTINPDTTLADLGLDSLMGVEVKQTLERDYDLALSMREIRLLTVNTLKGIGGGDSKTETASPVEEKATDTDSIVGLNDSGISIRYDPSNIVPEKTVIPLNSVKNEAPPLFIVHPIEGN